MISSYRQVIELSLEIQCDHAQSGIQTEFFTITNYLIFLVAEEKYFAYFHRVYTESRFTFYTS